VDTARYIVALLVWLAIPPAVLYWLMIHPFAERWRRVGVRPTFVIVFAAFMAVAGVLFLLRDLVLVREFGTHWLMWVAAAVIYIIAIALEVLCRRQLKFRTLTGVPELRADQSDRPVLSEGMYARVRHPRYLTIMVAILAMAVFANYLVTWIMVPVTAASLWLIAVLEERELVRSLGSAYEDYRTRVPMFVPKLIRRMKM